MTGVLACAAALASATPAAAHGPVAWAAHPPVPVGNDGRPIGATHHRWMHQAKVPLVRGRLRLVFRSCPRHPQFVGCVFSRHPRRIYLKRQARDPRAVLYHELGHVFDLLVLNRRERRAFKRVMGVRKRRWYGGSRPVAEWFADGYSLCARRRSLTGTAAQTPYGYRPSRRQHAALCRLIKRAAAPRGARPQAPRKPPPLVEPPAPPPSPPPAPDGQPAPTDVCSWLEGFLAGCR